MNTTTVSPAIPSVVSNTVKLMDFGNGKYSKLAKEFAVKSRMYYGFTDEQATRFGHAIMSDLGAANMEVDSVKIGKTDKNGFLRSLSTSEKAQKGVIVETYAFTCAAGILEIEKALNRLPEQAKFVGHIELPIEMQFIPKQQGNKIVPELVVRNSKGEVTEVIPAHIVK